VDYSPVDREWEDSLPNMMNKAKPKKAVALKYEPHKDNAPLVVAKGAGITAEKILELANKYNIKVQEDDALVQLLYQLELNQEIPPNLYPIIAELFAMIYQAEQRMAQNFT